MPTKEVFQRIKVLKKPKERKKKKKKTERLSFFFSLGNRGHHSRASLRAPLIKNVVQVLEYFFFLFLLLKLCFLFLSFFFLSIFNRALSRNYQRRLVVTVSVRWLF
jgi:hypothetical protein